MLHKHKKAWNNRYMPNNCQAFLLNPAQNFILHFGLSCDFSVPASGRGMPPIATFSLPAFISSLMLMVLGMAVSTGGLRSAACAMQSGIRWMYGSGDAGAMGSSGIEGADCATDGDVSGSGWISVIPSVLASCASTDFKESNIRRSRAASSALSCFNSSSFFHVSSTTCFRTGISFSMSTLSRVYFSIRRGMLSKALMKFRQAVCGSAAKRPLL